MIKAAIFDMDGTLLYTLSDLARSVNHALAELGLPERSLDEVRAGIGNGVGNLMRLALPQGADEALCARALELFRAHYEKNSRVDTRPYPGIPQLLDSLRLAGVRTAIVSNKFDSAVKELNSLWFGVDVAIGESSLCRRKPAPDMVLMALEALELSPADCAYIGDSEVDYHTAVNSGCMPVMAGWGYRSRQELEALAEGLPIADTPEQVLSFLLPESPAL
ncbi:MAG: HAD family hydrolase [Candidatus Heteroscillospira sp.]|jgi:phosphoglycolate phosphatase